ncbi:hypothetical protein VTK73DRAFT_9764 [Phialemonium thermophilum]|uniref:Uncharacterized protein n=1 Tax=Phialemonium thermophilum TaxID=223376 RepID=A0ABR3XJP0_9PEZI
MTPTTPNQGFFDLRVQILENCRFISRPNSQFMIITTREPLGTFKAITLRTEKNKRETFLAGSSRASVQEALESLHSKSAEASQQYIEINGFEYIFKIKKHNPKDADDEAERPGSAFSTAHISDSDSSTCEVLSDDETVSVTSDSGKKEQTKGDSGLERRNANEKGKRGRRSWSPSRSRSPSSSPGSSGADDDDKRRGPYPTVPLSTAQTGFLVQQRPTPPGWMNNAVRVQVTNHDGPAPPPRDPVRRGEGADVGIPLPPPSPPCPPHSQAKPHRPAGSYDVILHIKWLGHGEQRVIDQALPSIRAIQVTALEYVRRNPYAFHSVSFTETSPGAMMSLRATVRRATVNGDVTYELSPAFGGDDLRKLVNFTSANCTPRFEVDIERTKAMGPIWRERAGMTMARAT